VSLAGPLLAGAVGAALAAAVRIRDPHVVASWGLCPWLVATGLPCLACGGLRAAHDLVTGDLAGALERHAYLTCTLAALTLWWAAWLTAAALRRDAPRPSRPAALWSAWALGLALFGLARLLPGLAWLRP
jgi:hypothetical protein